MPAFPAFKTKPYYDALKTWLTTSLNDDGTIKDSAVADKVSAAIADDATVVAAAEQAAADAVENDPDLAPLKAPGSEGEVLTVVSGVPDWAPPPLGGGAVDSVNGQTGVVVLDAADVGAADGTHTHVLADITDYTAPTTDGTVAVQFAIDGGGSAIAAGASSDVRIPFSGTISAWEVVGDVSGSFVATVSKATYAAYPTFTAISGTEKPTLSSTQKATDTALSSWTTAVTAGDYLRLTVDSAATVQRVTVSLIVDDVTVPGASGGVITGGQKTGVTIAASNTASLLAESADYVCTGTNDHITWQAAIDAANAMSGGGGAVPVIPLHGTYTWADTVTAKASSIIATTEGGLTTTIRWNGLTSAVALTKPAGYSNGQSFWDLSGIKFDDSLNEPDVWLDIPYGASVTIDKFFNLHHCHFHGGRIQIRADRYVNAHWHDLRFDSWQEYAVEVNPEPLQSMSTFKISNFTADARITGTKGLIHVNLEPGGVGHGPMTLENGRIEFNTTFNTPVQGTWVLSDPGTTGTGNVVIVMRDVTQQNGTASNGVPIIYRDTTHTWNSQKFILDNFYGAGMTNLLGGNWATQQPNPTLPAGGWIPFMASDGDITTMRGTFVDL